MLTGVEDPSRRACKLAATHKWAVTHCIGTEMRLRDGKIVRCTSPVFHTGDFVEVTSIVNVSYLPGKHTARIKVQFALQEMVRLSSARELEVRARSTKCITS